MCLPPPRSAIEGGEQVLKLLSAERGAWVATADSQDEAQSSERPVASHRWKHVQRTQMPHLVMAELACARAQESNSGNDTEQAFT